MDKSEVIINEIETYISGKNNKKAYYQKFRTALLSFNDMNKDDDLIFLKDVIDRNLQLSLEDVNEYERVVDYFSEKTLKRAI